MKRMGAVVVMVVLVWSASAAVAGEYVVRFASGLAAEMNHSGPWNGSRRMSRRRATDG